MIRLYGDVGLESKTENIYIDEYTRDIASKLLEEMNLAGGIGLSANQIGLPFNMFVMMLTRGGTLTAINPQVVSVDPLLKVFPYDGCLSLPGVSAPTKRHDSIALSYQDVDGKHHSSVFYELESVIVQHEMDHLNGRLYIDQLGKLKRDMVLRKYLKLSKK